MFVHRQWRVRLIAIEIVFALSLKSEVRFFESNLFPYIKKFLVDPCSKIRDFSVKNLPALAKKFGETWLRDFLALKIKDLLGENSSFLYCETYLLALSNLAGLFLPLDQPSFVFQPMIKMLKESGNSHSYNVVILSMDLLKIHFKSIHPFRVRYELKPTLEKLSTDSNEKTIRERALAFLSEIET